MKDNYYIAGGKMMRVIKILCFLLVFLAFGGVVAQPEENFVIPVSIPVNGWTNRNWNGNAGSNHRLISAY